MTQRPHPFTRSIAVVVGIDAYDHGVPRLETAVNDARRLSEILRDEHGYDVTLLTNEDASLERLTRLLTKDLPAMVGADDRVLWYFAGHGVALPGDTGPDGYLLPADARRSDETSFLHMPLVHDALLSLPCRHMLVILDSCFSGAFRWSGTRDVVRAAKVVHREKFDRYVRDAAWQVLTSASQDQKALDQLSAGALGRREGIGGHSPFALALFDALSGKGDLIPSGTGDGLLLATELFLYIDDALRSAAIAAGHAQAPQLWPLRKHDKGEFLFFIPGRELSLPPAPALTAESNPWRGLASYESADARLFFGREAETARLVAHTRSHALSIVLGGSGSGKSSLVKAGLVPELAKVGWHALPVVRPGSAPLVALAAALGAPEPTAASCLAAVESTVAQHPDQPSLLIVDQFEELITLVRSPEERDALLGLLAEMCRRFPSQLRVVVTLRTDFEPNFDRSVVGPLWMQGRFVVAPMTRDNLRAVIELPAQQQVVYFDPSKLIDTLLDEVVATPGALPLLSFALSEMYLNYLKRRSDDRSITHGDYETLGGVVGALRARAESEYESLDPAHQATLQRVMLRLVVADGGTVARRRVTDDELRFDDPSEQQRVDTVTERLIAARLLVRGKDADGASFIEPAHDALVRGWGRLLQWIREAGEDPFPMAQRQRLTRAAAEWDRSDGLQRVGLLWGDPARSAQLASLVKRADPALNHRELDFARKSVRRRQAVRRLSVGAVVALAAAGIAAVIGGLQASARAEQVRTGALVQTASALAAEDPLKARLLLAALDEEDLQRATPATRLGFVGAAASLMMRPTIVRLWEEELEKGSMFAQLGADGQSVIVDADSSDADDGQWTPPRAVAALTDDGRIVIRYPDSTTAGPLSLGSPARFAAVSRDGASLAAILTDNRVLVRRVNGSRNTIALAIRDSVRRVVWSPDGRRLATTASEGVRVWDASTGRNTAHLVRPGDFPADVSFNRDATALVARSLFGYEAVVWRWTERPNEIVSGTFTILGGHADRLTRAHYAPDGFHVFTVSRDRTARLWKPWSWEEEIGTDLLESIEESGEEARIAAVAFHPDGHTFAIGSAGGTVGLVDIADPSRNRVIATRQAAPRVLAFHDNGNALSALTVSGQLLRWALDSPDSGRVVAENAQQVHLVRALGGDVYLTQGDSSLMVTSVHTLADSVDNTTTVNSDSSFAWSLTSEAPPTRVPGSGPALFARIGDRLDRYAGCLQPSTSVTRLSYGRDTLDVVLLGDAVEAAAYAPRPGVLATGSFSGAVELLGSDCTPQPLTPAHTSWVEWMEFSSDQRALLTAANDGTVKLWDVRARRLLVTLRPRGMAVESAHFTSDGRHVLTVPAVDTLVFLWNADGSGAPAVFSGSYGSLITDAWLSPDGRWLVTALDGGGATLWPLETRELLRRLRDTMACLSTNDRIRYLGETASTATERVQACKAGTGN